MPDSRSRVEAFFVALLFAGLGTAGIIYGARTSMPDLASRHGAGIDAMLNYLLVTVGAIFLIGYVLLGYFVWRGSRRAAAEPRRIASRRTELLVSGVIGLAVAVIGEGGVLAIGMPVWDEYFRADPASDAVAIEVTAQQFMWNVRYPGPDGVFGATDPALVDDATNPLGLVRSDPAGADDVLTINDIAVPVDRTVRIRLRSKDVIHSFFLPNFRVKQDAVPGMSPEVVFVATKAGDYELACAEVCGLAHYRMRGFFHVLADPEYRNWLQLQAAAGQAH
jgi:cytochrome c oxidase subunit 2